MKLLILGHAGHGKDTVANIITELTGLKATSSSQAALPFITPSLRTVYTAKLPGDMLAISKKTTRGRKLLKELISLYNTPDKTALTRLILKDHDIYNGMRDKEEFEASRHLFDHILWVDASERCPRKDATMEIEYDPDTMYVIDANGSIEDSREQIEMFLKSIGLLDKNPFSIENIDNDEQHCILADLCFQNSVNKNITECGVLVKNTSSSSRNWGVFRVDSRVVDTSQKLRHLAEFLDELNCEKS